MEWRDMLAEEFAVVEAAGDTVQRIELRPDVCVAVRKKLFMGSHLWGAVIEIVEDLDVPFRAHGVSGRDAFVAKAQRKWLDETYAKLVSQGATVTRITVEAENGDGIPITLTAEWPDRA